MSMSKIKSLVDKLECKLLPRSYFADKVYVLLYHSVSPRKHYLLEGMSDAIHIDTDKFIQQIEFLKQDFNIVSLRDYIRGQVDRESVVITFDDGYRDNYLNAYPILKQHEIPFSICINSNFIDNKDMFWLSKVNLLKENDLFEEFKHRYVVAKISKYSNNMDLECKINRFLCEKKVDIRASAYRNGLYLSKDEIKEMDDKLLTVLPHTHRHYKTIDLPYAERRREIGKSIAFCANNFPEYYEPIFSFPFGTPNETFDKIDIDILQEFNIRYYLSACNGLNTCGRHSHEIKRKSVYGRQELSDFKLFIEQPQLIRHGLKKVV